VAALAPGIEALCHGLIDRFPEGEPFDLLPAYAQPIPVAAIARLLGVPEEDAPALLRWSHAMVAMYQAGRSRVVEDAAAAAAAEFAAYLRRATRGCGAW
jgi:cytochrome P450